MFGVVRLKPLEATTFHWPDANRGRNLCAKFEEFGWQWSGQFSVDYTDDFVIKVRNTQSHEERLIHISIV